MRSVLLTGATGFVGRHSIPYLLERGYTVHAVTSAPLDSIEVSSGLIWHRCDLLDPEQTGDLVKRLRATHLLHFAWYVEHGKFWDAPENTEWVRASESLFESFVAAGGRRIVSAGTCAEYDWQVDQERFSEKSSPIGPRTLYGRSKNDLHISLQRIAAKSGVSYAWGRIFFLFGPFEHPGRFVPSVIRSLLNGDEARCSSGEQIRDMMYVSDAAEAFATLLGTELNGAVNIGSGSPTKIKNVATAIARTIGNPELLHFGAISTSVDDPPCLVACNYRLTNEAKFVAHHGLDSAIDLSIGWWRQLLVK